MFLCIRPLLNLEFSLKWGIRILFPTFMLAMFISTILAETYAFKDYSVVYLIMLISLMMVHAGASNFIEFKLA